MAIFDFTKLYFEDLNVSEVQTTVGITIKFGETTIRWANTAGDLGGEPETLDCTPLSANVQMNKAGIQSVANWTVDYFFNETDFQALEANKKAPTESEIVVTLPSGATFKNKGKCTANYATGVAVNGLLTAHAVFELSSNTGWTYTPATPEPSPSSPSSP